MANFRIPTKKILSEQNISKIIMTVIGLRDEMENIEKELITEYDSTKTYSPDMACYYNDYLYRCLFTTTGEFNINSWKRVGDSLELVNKAQVEAMLGLTPDELDTLANIILDSEVRLDKTWSSSKIYESVQEAIRENKKFTLEEFAKANKASYTVVDSVDTMTDQSTIYLLKNDTTYDMYIVQVDGTPTKIGDTTIDLSQFYTKTEIDNDFVKKTDADGKYAIITTVDGKVDKTSILSAISSTPSDDKLLSEKAIKSELDTINTNLDDKIDKASITTTIDSSSTDSELPTAKAVNELNIRGTLIDQSVVDKYGTEIIKYPLGRWYFYSTNLARQFSDIPWREACIIDITSISDSGNPWDNVWTYRNYKAQTIANRGTFVRQLESRITAGTLYDTGWQRVCTTGVNDKSWTTIPESSITNATLVSGGSLTYSIKNGVCYIRLNGLVLSGKGNVTVPTGAFPIPDNRITNGHYPVVTNGNACLLTMLNSSGGLTINCGTNTGTIYTTISYPVKESE